MREIHEPYCRNHSEDICNATDLTAGKWEIGLAACAGVQTIYMWHPEKLPAEEQGALTPTEAIKLGWALIRQGMRALRGRSRQAHAIRGKGVTRRERGAV